MNRYFRFLPVFILSVLLAGATEQRPLQKSVDPLPLLGDPVAEDEIFNEGTSNPVVSFSLVQGGLGTGTTDGGNNIDSEADLIDVFGADAAVGTTDDDLKPTAQSPAVDAGSNAILPADRFDLDGDGNTTEPLPMDRAGNARKHDGGTGSSVADLGAYEFGAPVATSVEEPTTSSFQTYLSQPFPNPTKDGFNVRFGVQTPSSVRILVYDVLGREMLLAFDDQVQSDRDYQVRIRTETLASGVYFVRLLTNTTEMSRQFILAR